MRFYPLETTTVMTCNFSFGHLHTSMSHKLYPLIKPVPRFSMSKLIMFQDRLGSLVSSSQYRHSEISTNLCSSLEELSWMTAQPNNDIHVDTKVSFTSSFKSSLSWKPVFRGHFRWLFRNMAYSPKRNVFKSLQMNMHMMCCVFFSQLLSSAANSYCDDRVQIIVRLMDGCHVFVHTVSCFHSLRRYYYIYPALLSTLSMG
jgi:hypothetical protein